MSNKCFYKMSVEPEKMEGKYYDMSARDSKEEVGQHFKMSAEGAEETGRIKHAEHKQTEKGI
jgi:hypothetical protein